MNDTLWFKAKEYGWGWYPVTWQGWAIIVMYVFSLLTNAFFFDAHVHSVSDFLIGFFPNAYILTVFMIIICYAKGEKPEWRWGKKKSTDGSNQN